MFDAAAGSPWRVGWRTGVLVAVGVIIALPYLVLGPNFLLDDWIFVRNRHFDGAVSTATTGVAWLSTARPGAWATYTAVFGLLGEHPAAIYVVQSAVNISIALALYALLKRFFPTGLAFSAALVWLFLPTHSATDHWGSALNIGVAVLLLLVGLGWLTDAVRNGRSWVVAGCALVGGALCYEAVLPAAFLAAAVAAWLVRGRPAFRSALLLVGWTGAAGAWMLAFTPKPALDGVFDLTALPAAHFGATAVGGAAWPAGLAVLLGSLLAIARGDAERRLVLAGLAFIVVGVLAWARFPIVLIGIGDRANAVSALGAAMVWTAALHTLSARRVFAGIVVVAAVMLPVRHDRDLDYHWAGETAVKLAATRAPGPMVVLGQCPRFRNFVTGLMGYWDATPALQVRRDDRSVEARFVHNAPVGVWNGGRCRPQEGFEGTSSG